MRYFLLFSFLHFFSIGSQAFATELILKKKTGQETIQLETVAIPSELRVIEPHEQRLLGFKAVSLEKVLDKTYGKEWRSNEELLVTCSDGYQPSIPVQLLLEHKAYLAVARTEGEFAINNKLQGNERVKLGPLYLVWDNQSDEVIRSHGASIWPYQVTHLEFVSFADKFGAMAPPPQSSSQAKAGFLAFRHYCQSCHRINGLGGEKSIELNYPVNVTEYYRSEFLERWIGEPTSIRYGTLMPALSAEAPKRAQMIKDLVAYLEAMKAKKIKPVVKN